MLKVYPAAIPRTAEINMTTIGCTFLTSNIIIIIKITNDMKKSLLVKTDKENPSGINTDCATEITDEPIIPITAGFNPFIQPITYLFAQNAL